jgi:hypothetical protein
VLWEALEGAWAESGAGIVTYAAGR